MYYNGQNNPNYLSEFNGQTNCYDHNYLLDQYILCEDVQVETTTTLPNCTESMRQNSEMYNNNYDFLVNSESGCNNTEFSNNCHMVCESLNNIRTSQGFTYFKYRIT